MKIVTRAVKPPQYLVAIPLPPAAAVGFVVFFRADITCTRASPRHMMTIRPYLNGFNGLMDGRKEEGIAHGNIMQ